MQKGKYITIIAFILLFASTGFCYALETTYPPIPGLPAPSASCTGVGCLPVLAAYWFGILTYLVAFVAVLSFAIGGITFIAAAENVEAKSNAKDRIKSSLLGLGLTIASFLLIQTINESLVTPAMIEMPPLDGVFYTNGTENKPCPSENSDVSTVDSAFRTIKYICSSGPALLIWEFPGKNLEGGDSNLSEVKVVRKNCNETENISGYGSFRIAFETPGIYYCLDGCSGSMCSSYMSQASSSNDEDLSGTFGDNKIKAVRIVNDISNGLYYGAIMHKEKITTEAGECSYPIVNEGESSICRTIDMDASSANIFVWNSTNPTPEKSGNNVAFYSEPYGYASGAQKRGEGFCVIENQNIGRVFIADYSYFDFKKSGGCDYSSATNAKYKNLYGSFISRPGSVYLDGNYLVVFYSGNNANNSDYCQVFTKNVANLKTKTFTVTGHSISKVYIIPVK